MSPSRSSAYPNVGDEPQQREYDNFLRSTKGEHDGSSHGLTSVPTDYSSPRASVDATMPSSLIEHGSVSDVGEQSSHDLGEIPEKPKGGRILISQIAFHMCKYYEDCSAVLS